MLKFVAAVFAISVSVIAAPQAGADPDILTPDCSSGQIPETGECQPEPNDVYVDNAPGPDPEVPVGLNPESVPAV
ncbi:MAG: hypothetical protein KDB50_08705 [Mycobacterium sp.]|nr:hypothetical protein [Mycobacterium sp.]